MPTYSSDEKRFKPRRGTKRRKIDFSSIVPAEHCHKCGRDVWNLEAVPFTWSCFCCGNLIYFTYGVFRQQIDIHTSACRDHGFVKSDRGLWVPKRNEEIRRIKFRDGVLNKARGKKSKREKRKKIEAQTTPTGE